MSVILRKRKNADGTTSLRLDIHHENRRWIETLKDLKLCKPSNITDRQGNKNKVDLAERIAVKRAEELAGGLHNVISRTGGQTDVTNWMQSYVDGYTKKDKRNMQGVLNHFSDFLSQEKKPNLTFSGLTPLLIEDFIEYLESKGTGEGPSSYYNRFKKMVKQAFRKKLLRENVLDLVERKIKGKAKKKEILTLPEIKQLAATPTESVNVKQAFLFTCVTGLRWVDIKALTWQNIQLEHRLLRVDQSKTEESVAIPLNDTAIKLLKEPGKPNEQIFHLPSANGANKSLKAWVKRAGIKKKITWHNGRHSFGTNLIFNEVDILTTSKLLGHTSLKHTQRYVDAAKEMKSAATDKLNFQL